MTKIGRYLSTRPFHTGKGWYQLRLGVEWPGGRRFHAGPKTWAKGWRPYRYDGRWTSCN